MSSRVYPKVNIPGWGSWEVREYDPDSPRGPCPIHSVNHAPPEENHPESNVNQAVVEDQAVDQDTQTVTHAVQLEDQSAEASTGAEIQERIDTTQPKRRWNRRRTANPPIVPTFTGS